MAHCYAHRLSLLNNPNRVDANVVPYKADNAEVKIKVSKGELVFERILTGRGKGIYQKKLEIIEPGNYSYKGDARFSERIIGEDSGEFTFSEFSMEMLETRMRNDILQGISNKSSGKFYHTGNIQNLSFYLTLYLCVSAVIIFGIKEVNQNFC